MNYSDRLTMLERMGYGLGSIGESALFILYSFYALFFMTDIAGIDTVIAGTIISISMIVNAIYVIFIGIKTDRCKSKAGRRIPFMRAAIIPAFIFVVMGFTVVELPEVIKIIYYGVAVMGMLLLHTTYVIPYEALGAEIAASLEDRNSIRNYAKFFMGVGTLVGLSLTAYLTDFFNSIHLSDEKAWQFSITIVMIISVICLASCVVILKEKAALSVYEKQDETKTNIVKEYIQVARIKPFRYLLMVTAICSVNFAFSSPAMIYYMTCNMELPGRYQSIVFVVITLTNIGLTPLTAGLARKLGKENTMIVAYVISGLGLIAFAWSDIESVIILMVIVVISTIGNSAYYQFIFPMYYDIGTIDTYETGRKREATILSLAKTVLKVFTAVGTQLVAVMMALFGYDEAASVQTDSALMGIRFSFILIPGILYLAAALCMKFYPVTEEKLKKYIEKKEEQE
ncbi:MAG: MFS transporter [Anaerovoracaceae bacterium]